MEVLGVVANVIAVVELSATVASYCIQYSRAVTHAKADIERLEAEVNSVTVLLKEVYQLLQRPGNTQLSTSQKLCNALKDCFLQLEQLNAKLEPGKKQRVMSRIGVRAFKWPFQSKEVAKIINNLDRYKQTFSQALQVDQTYVAGLFLPPYRTHHIKHEC
jgi:hypothetical protein